MSRPTSHSILTDLVLFLALRRAGRLFIIPARTICYSIAHIVSVVIYQQSALYRFKTHQSSIVPSAFIAFRPKSFSFSLKKDGSTKLQRHHLHPRSPHQGGENQRVVQRRGIRNASESADGGERRAPDNSPKARTIGDPRFLRLEFCSAGTGLRSPELLQTMRSVGPRHVSRGRLDHLFHLVPSHRCQRDCSRSCRKQRRGRLRSRGNSELIRSIRRVRDEGSFE